MKGEKKMAAGFIKNQLLFCVCVMKFYTVNEFVLSNYYFLMEKVCIQFCGFSCFVCCLFSLVRHMESEDFIKLEDISCCVLRSFRGMLENPPELNQSVRTWLMHAHTHMPLRETLFSSLFHSPNDDPLPMQFMP